MNRDELTEEHSFVRRSIEDLELERSAGEVSDEDYSRLLARYQRRAEELEHQLATEALVPPTGSPPPGESGEGTGGRRPGRARRALRTRRGRLATGWTAFGCFAAAALVLSLSLAGVGPFAKRPGLPVSERVQIMLAEASVLGSHGKLTQALDTYRRVLALRPRQPEALADGGWLERLVGKAGSEAALVRDGDAEIAAAVRIDPGLAVARAYDGVVLSVDRHEPGRAAREFTQMLEDHPSARLLRSIRAEAVAAFHAAHRPVPAGLAGSGG